MSVNVLKVIVFGDAGYNNGWLPEDVWLNAALFLAAVRLMRQPGQQYWSHLLPTPHERKERAKLMMLIPELCSESDKDEPTQTWRGFPISRGDFVPRGEN